MGYLPDPNTFGGPIRLRRVGVSEWEDLPLDPGFGFEEQSRGLGLADMAEAIQLDRPHRASGELALHVLELMHAIHTASAEGRHIQIKSRVERPAIRELPESID